MAIKRNQSLTASRYVSISSSGCDTGKAWLYFVVAVSASAYSGKDKILIVITFNKSSSLLKTMCLNFASFVFKLEKTRFLEH